MKALSKFDNKIFAHYIFMDNEFFLPTVIGVPLRIALSGIFTPGIKGGLEVTPDMVNILKKHVQKLYFTTSCSITKRVTNIPLYSYRVKLASCRLLALSL